MAQKAVVAWAGYDAIHVSSIALSRQIEATQMRATCLNLTTQCDLTCVTVSALNALVIESLGSENESTIECLFITQITFSLHDSAV